METFRDQPIFWGGLFMILVVVVIALICGSPHAPTREPRLVPVSEVDLEISLGEMVGP